MEGDEDLILEIISTSVSDARLAQANGADRIELISGIMEGGVTPSYALIEKVISAVSIPVHVMVRPHANSFCYDDDDLAVMRNDIRVIRKLGAAGIVLGALTPEGTVDTSALQTLLPEAGEMAVTFHRAFDELKDLREGLRVLAGYPAINRVLTSGGKKSALDAVQEIAELVELSKELQIRILAGSGLRNDALDEFIRATGVSEVHMGTGVRVNGQALALVDGQKVKAAAEIIAKYN